MHPLFEKADALTGEVIEAAIEVQKHYWIGLLENIYKLSLGQEMRIRGHKAETEKVVPITYKGFTFEEKLRLDCLIDDCLLVECKSLDEDKVDMERHRAQTLSYMKLMNIPLAIPSGAYGGGYDLWSSAPPRRCGPRPPTPSRLICAEVIS